MRVEALHRLGIALMNMGVWTNAEEVLREAGRSRSPTAPLNATLIHLVLGVALTNQVDAAKQEEGGQNALRSALEQLQLRTDEIDDAALRESYLALGQHRRVMELAREHGILHG